MSAVTFDEVLKAIKDSKYQTEEVTECLIDLASCGVDLAENLPALSREHRRRKRYSQGEIIITSLSMEESELVGQLSELYADCYIALADWIVAWNRAQIQGLAG